MLVYRTCVFLAHREITPHTVARLSIAEDCKSNINYPLALLTPEKKHLSTDYNSNILTDLSM